MIYINIYSLTLFSPIFFFLSYLILSSTLVYPWFLVCFINKVYIIIIIHSFMCFQNFHYVFILLSSLIFYKWCIHSFTGGGCFTVDCYYSLVHASINHPFTNILGGRFNLNFHSFIFSKKVLILKKLMTHVSVSLFIHPFIDHFSFKLESNRFIFFK